MMIGVRFCGGCNPVYDRGAMLEKLKAHFADRIAFAIAVEDVSYDGLLVLGGCHNCCASFAQFKTKTEPVLMWNLSQEDQVQRFIENNMDSKQ